MLKKLNKKQQNESKITLIKYEPLSNIFVYNFPTF